MTFGCSAAASMAAGDFRFLKTATTATPKVMLPAPSLAHWFVGDRVFAGSPYGSAREYMADIARIYREEIAELASLGCTYVQIDEVPIAVICDPAVQSVIADRGEVPSRWSTSTWIPSTMRSGIARPA